MFCKNCGNQMNDGQTFCSNCGTKVEEVNNNAVAGVTEQVPNAQGTMNNEANTQMNMNTNLQMGVSMNTNSTANASVNGTVGNPGGSAPTNTVGATNGNNTGKNNGSKKIIIIVIVVAFVFFAIIIGGFFFLVANISYENLKSESDIVGETAKNTNEKLYKGYNFTIPKDCVVSVLGTGELSITKGDTTFLIIVDNSTYEANLQYFISVNPSAANDAEITVKNRKVAGGFRTDGSAILFTKASDTQIFVMNIASTDGKVELSDIEFVADILNGAKKDESTFSSDQDASTGGITNSITGMQAGIGTMQ